MGPLSDLVDLVLARTCAGCGAAGTRWCGECALWLSGTPISRTLVSGSPDLRVWSAAAYSAPVRAALVGWKDRDRPDLSPVLAAAAGRAARAALGALDLTGEGTAVVVVPAPSSAAARRSRGWHPVRDLAGRTALGLRRRGTPARMLPVLRQRRGVRDQAGLGADERSANLVGALWVPVGWRPHVRGRLCLIVDDVVTTGATLTEAARALRDAGAGPVVAATVAATVLRRAAGPSSRTIGVTAGPVE